MHKYLDFRPVQIVTGHVIYNSPYKYWPAEHSHSGHSCTLVWNSNLERTLSGSNLEVIILWSPLELSLPNERLAEGSS